MGEEIVHIIPLGYEIDRAVKPFEKYKANRVYILSIIDTFGKYSPEMTQRQKYYVDAVSSRLKSYGIKVIVKNVDMFEILEVIRHISNIIFTEKAEGNTVYVNISSGGRLTSVAAYLAAMAHDAKAYYVVADRYASTEDEKLEHGLSICEKLRVNFLEKFKLQLPRENEMKVLVKLCREGKSMKTTDIIEYLASEGVRGFENCADMRSRKIPRKQKINCLMKLNKAILAKLEANGYIEREKTGRYNEIKITHAGKYVAYISGFLK